MLMCVHYISIDCEFVHVNSFINFFSFCKCFLILHIFIYVVFKHAVNSFLINLGCFCCREFYFFLPKWNAAYINMFQSIFFEYFFSKEYVLFFASYLQQLLLKVYFGMFFVVFFFILNVIVVSF